MLSGRSTPSRLNRASSQLLLRLDSLPRIRNTPTRTQRPPKPSLPTCKNPECSDSDVGEDDGKLICRNCGFIVQEINITQELTFGEASNGAAVVQGVYVGANDETARNPALGSSKVAGGMDSRQITERNGRSAKIHVSSLLNNSPRASPHQQPRCSIASEHHLQGTSYADLSSFNEHQFHSGPNDKGGSSSLSLHCLST